MTRIKLSGVCRLEDARFAAAMGADYLAFDQRPGSPRAVSSAHAREIVDWVVGPQPVGMFADDQPEKVVAACEAAGFRLAQLDGHESPAECARVEAAGIPVIKSFTVLHDASAEQMRVLMGPYAGAARYVRLETDRTSLWGGEGESVSWRLARELADEFDLFLAGAVSAENVLDALRMRPFALDLGASVEEGPGVMDFDRLGVFFDAFRLASGGAS